MGKRGGYVYPQESKQKQGTRLFAAGPKRDDESGGGWPVREGVGSAIWVSTFYSWPDISFAVRGVARHAHAPTERHWKAIMQILAHLKGTRDLDMTGVGGGAGGTRKRQLR